MRDPNPWVSRVFSPEVTLTFGETRPTPISIVIMARDEERCIARCLDSVAGRGFDTVLVVDTGSTDKTPDIVAGYRDHGVRLVRQPWPGSFGQARNSAIEQVASGWVVFLDADEWLSERAAEDLGPCLASLTGIEDVARLVFAPRIFDVDRGGHDEGVPRIFLADSAIRYRGQVHEYPVVEGRAVRPVGLVGLDIEFRHDGYNRAVASEKRKRERNLALLEAALACDPENPRWWYYTLRDALPVLDSARIVELCSTLRRLADGGGAGTGELLSARTYYRLALTLSCQGLAALGDWTAVERHCDLLDALDSRDNPDAHYFRSVSGLLTGVVTERGLLRTIRLRGDEELVAGSVLDRDGSHLDAVIATLVARLRGPGEAARYLELCAPWTDAFFERSVPRHGHR